MLEALEQSYQRQGIDEDILGTDIVVTADTGYANEANNQYLHDRDINGYIPDNAFRSRDPRYQDKVAHHGSKRKKTERFSAAQFDYDPANQTCRCPAGELLPLKHISEDANGKSRAYFEGRLNQCRSCALRTQCLSNPDAANHRKGHGRQVSFLANPGKRYTEWMKARVDSIKGKLIYSHRMSVVEPVFANIESAKGLRRFSLRGKTKVATQWRMFCLVHNMEKLMGYGQLTT